MTPIKTMKYQIRHTTRFQYSSMVSVCHNRAHLTPHDSLGQVCHENKIHITPEPALLTQRKDYFGNLVTYFTVQEPHKELVVTGESRVEVQSQDVPDPKLTRPWESVRDGLRLSRKTESLEAIQFSFPSRYVAVTEELHQYAQTSFPPGRPVLEGVLDLTRRIHEDFEYSPLATDLATPVMDVFRMRRGVCQDFAHLEIACLRSLGLAACYVSGYLRTLPPEGQPALVGADASHAWLSVYLEDHLWVDLDPTNNTICGTDHISVAWGLDYDDVSPVRGVMLGGGDQIMSVSVEVTEVH